MAQSSESCTRILTFQLLPAFTRPQLRERGLGIVIVIRNRCRLMQPVMAVVIRPRTTTGRCSRLPTWVGRFSLRVEGHPLYFFGPTSRVRRATYDFLTFPCVFPVYLCSCAHLSDGSPHATGGQNLLFLVRLFFMLSC